MSAAVIPSGGVPASAIHNRSAQAKESRWTPRRSEPGYHSCESRKNSLSGFTISSGGPAEETRLHNVFQKPVFLERNTASASCPSFHKLPQPHKFWNACPTLISKRSSAGPPLLQLSGVRFSPLNKNTTVDPIFGAAAQLTGDFPSDSASGTWSRGRVPGVG